ncbi:hypothetical protein ACOMHN_037541 [Nucella lapillus]
MSPNNVSSTCFNSKDNESIIESCLSQQCLSAQVISELYGVSLKAPLDQKTLIEVAPAVLYTLKERGACLTHEGRRDIPKPSPTAVWGYGFLFVTLINLCSLTGIIVLPCMKTAIYNVILMFMVALAVGTLVGSGVLVLIPEAFELAHVGGGGGGEEGGSGDSYIWTSTSVIGGIYLFFLIERIMRIINICKENTKDKKRRDELATRGTLTSSFTRKTPHVANMEMKNPATLHLENSPSAECLCSMSAMAQHQPSPSNCSRHSCEGETTMGESGNADLESRREGDEEENHAGVTTSGALIKKTPNKSSEVNGHGHGHGHGHSHHHHEGGALQGGEGAGQVAPVAYMIIFGDGLHNFIDGLSIGAAFTDSVLLGISVSVAVICEELPHELGDFAILLNAGMRLRRALMYNFLSSLMCYFGLALGILVGEHTTAHTWIFGVAGGMFLYIALVDMMPEMNSAAESKEGKQFGVGRTFVVQNVGLVTGYSIILLMTLYGDVFSFE